MSLKNFLKEYERIQKVTLDAFAGAVEDNPPKLPPAPEMAALIEKGADVVPIASTAIAGGSQKAIPITGANGLTRETPAQRRTRRHSVIDPLLLGKGLSVHQWEQEAGVSSKTGRRYIDGKTVKLSNGSRSKLADVLGSDLPY